MINGNGFHSITKHVTAMEPKNGAIMNQGKPVLIYALTYDQRKIDFSYVKQGQFVVSDACH